MKIERIAPRLHPQDPRPRFRRPDRRRRSQAGAHRRGALDRGRETPARRDRPSHRRSRRPAGGYRRQAGPIVTCLRSLPYELAGRRTVAIQNAELVLTFRTPANFGRRRSWSGGTRSRRCRWEECSASTPATGSGLSSIAGRASISVGDVHDQCFGIVRDRALVGASGTLAAAVSQRPSSGCGRFSGGIHDVFVVHV